MPSPHVPALFPNVTTPCKLENILLRKGYNAYIKKYCESQMKKKTYFMKC